MSNPDETLGVAASAFEAEIRSACRKLAKEFHPALNPGDTGGRGQVEEGYQGRLSRDVSRGGGDAYRRPKRSTGNGMMA